MYKVPAVSITRQPFVTSATITWYPGEIQWNTLLIDSSSHRCAHFSHWDMCSISNGSRDNSSTRSHRVYHHSLAICYISHYNLRTRRVTVKHSINRLFLSSRRTFQPLRYVFYLKWFSWYFKYKVPAVSITRQPFVTSATITWYPGELQWNTLLIDSSSHRGAHFCHWDMCSILNGSRDISSTRSQRIKHHTTAICYISHYNLRSRRVTVNTLLIDCSSHRGAHFSHWDMCSISNGSRNISSTRSQRFPLHVSHLLNQPL